MESKRTEAVEDTTTEVITTCQCLLDGFVSLTILDLLQCFIFFIVMRWIENRYLFPRALLLQFLLSYLFEKLCPKYINLILSYVYISTCKSILLKSIPKIGLFLVTRSRGKIVFGVSASAFVFIPATFFLKLYVVNNCCLNHLAFFGVFIPHSNISSCPAKGPEDEIDIKDIKLTIDDIRIVLQKLCQCTKEERDDIVDDYNLGYEEFFSLFEDLEPGFDEVFEAFSIFDQDQDGFFDAKDLRIVLLKLGLGEDTDLNECELMIEQHVSCCDGKISSSDFRRILEISLM